MHHALKAITIAAASLVLTGVASAGNTSSNTSSNSSSNSSNGVHTRHDTLVIERNGRRFVRERYERSYDRPRRENRRRWREADDD
jgi:hypothetical protein